MKKYKISPSKITGQPATGNDKAVITVIVNVSVAEYVPDWLQLRSRITSFIFTADIRSSDMARLEADDKVVSVAINEQLNMTE